MKETSKTVAWGIINVMAGVLIHLTFGFVATRGNMIPYILSIIRLHDFNFHRGSEIWLTASSIAVQGAAMPLGGLLASKIGSRGVIMTGCLLHSGGTVLTYFTIDKNFGLVILTYSIISGLGVGLAYSVVYVVATTWFPRKKALIIGLCISGFAAGSIIFMPIQQMVINPNNIRIDNETNFFTDPKVIDRIKPGFCIFGGILFPIQLICSIILHSKPEKEKEKVPESSKSEVMLHKITNDEVSFDDIVSRNGDTAIHREDSANIVVEEDLNEPSISVSQVLKSPEFYLLWTVMLCGAFPITLISTVFKVFGSEHITNDFFLSGVATTAALCGAIGGVLCGALTDKLSFKLPLIVMIIFWAIILLVMPYIFLWEAAAMALYAICVCSIFLSLSAIFVMLPAAVSQLFGAGNMATVYGLIYTAFSIGSLLCAIICHITGGHWVAMFTGCGCISLFAAFLMIFVHDPLMPKRCTACLPCNRIYSWQTTKKNIPV